MKVLTAYMHSCRRANCPYCGGESINIESDEWISWECESCDAVGIGFKSPKKLYMSLNAT